MSKSMSWLQTDIQEFGTELEAAGGVRRFASMALLWVKWVAGREDEWIGGAREMYNGELMEYVRLKEHLEDLEAQGRGEEAMEIAKRYAEWIRGCVPPEDEAVDAGLRTRTVREQLESLASCSSQGSPMTKEARATVVLGRIQALAALEIGDALREIAHTIRDLVPIPLTQEQHARKLAGDLETYKKVADFIVSIFREMGDD